jgi:hypothetical protein
MSDRAAIWSYGGGVQTAAIGVLVVQGKLPHPERIVMADTGREDSATWSYLDTVMAPYLAAVGLTVEVAPHSLATVDLHSTKGDLLIPAFTATGKLPTYCSVEWKQRVVQRWLRAQGYGPAKPVSIWLGMSTDEASRAKDSATAWAGHHYPILYDVPMNRAECVGLVASAGLPPAPKSSCWMCPFRSNTQWRDLKANRPEDWDKAVAFDAEIRRKDSDVFVHRSGTPLASADLGEDADNQRDLFGSCGTGYCYV